MTLPTDTHATPEVRRVYQNVLEEASRSGERYVSLIRIMMCSLLLLRQVLMEQAELQSGEAKAWVAIGCLVFTLGYSVVVVMAPHLIQRVLPRLRTQLLVSATLDVLVLVVSLLGTILSPTTFYGGFLALPYPMLFLVAMILLGLRLDPKVLWYGIGLNFIGMSALVITDYVLWPERIRYDASYPTFVFVMFLGQAGVTAFLTHRVEKLVARSAQQLTDAERMRQRFGAYLSDEIAEATLAGREIEMGGSRQQVAILFSDLRGFTSYSEKLEPDALVTELNAYFEAMVSEIQAEGGVVDKYIGDSIMAVFGAPHAKVDDAARALRAASRMRLALDRHNGARATQGLPPLRQGIGVHYGWVIAGNIGTTSRPQYTVIGDAVNLCSRLESSTKLHDVQILVSKDVVLAATSHQEGLPHDLEPLGTIEVRGRAQKIEVFALDRLSDDISSHKSEAPHVHPPDA